MFRTGVLTLTIMLFGMTTHAKDQPINEVRYFGGFEEPRCKGQEGLSKIPESWRDCSYIGSLRTMTTRVTWWGSLNSKGNMHGTQTSDHQALDHKFFKRCVRTFEDGKMQGWEICRGKDGSGLANGPVISKKFYVNGKHSPEKEVEIQKTSYRTECKEIGFSPKTEKFAECILRLMELKGY